MNIYGYEIAIKKKRRYIGGIHVSHMIQSLVNAWKFSGNTHVVLEDAKGNRYTIHSIEFQPKDDGKPVVIKFEPEVGHIV